MAYYGKKNKKKPTKDSPIKSYPADFDKRVEECIIFYKNFYSTYISFFLLLHNKYLWIIKTYLKINMGLS